MCFSFTHEVFDEINYLKIVILFCRPAYIIILRLVRVSKRESIHFSKVLFESVIINVLANCLKPVFDSRKKRHARKRS